MILFIGVIIFVGFKILKQKDKSDKEIPFLTYLYQEESARHIIDAIEKGYDMPIQKSRKMGLSWLVIVILVWGFAFKKMGRLGRKREGFARRFTWRHGRLNSQSTLYLRNKSRVVNTTFR